MTLKDIFKKQGGWKLIKQYWRSGSLFTAVCEFILLGKSRTALEILRLSAYLKAKQKLEKKYKNKLIQFDQSYDNTLPHEKSDKVWICWFQGMENAPYIVKRCYKSVKDNMPDKEIIVLNSDNILEYVQFPDYILEKWKKGIISDAHMSDLLRLELLTRYGGMWLDATVFCCRKDIEPYYFESDLFLYQSLKPGRDGHSSYISSWLISAKTNNKILMATKTLCYEYWKEHDYLMDYFLFHDFLSIVLEYYPGEWNNIVPKDNATPHILLLRLFEQYDEDTWKAIKGQTPFHKLSHKFTDKQTEIKDTYYKILLSENY